MNRRISLFFSKAFEMVENKGVLDTDYVMFLSDMMLIKYPAANVNDVFDMISNYFPYKQLKKNQFADEFEIRYGKNIKLNSKQIENINDAKEFMKELTSYMNEDNIFELVNCDLSEKVDYKFLIKFFALHCIKYKYDILFYSYKYISLKEGLPIKLREIKDVVQNISEENYYVKCEEVFDCDVILQLLNKFNIESLEQLKNSSVALLAYIFCLDHSRILKRIRLYTNIEQDSFNL